MIEPSPQLLDETLVSEIRLPTRIRKALHIAGFETVGEVRQTPDKSLFTLQNFGVRSIATLRRLLGGAP